jgi:prepilin signal peptidase PulO-like enzyme (type II secretory pathway)
LSVFSLILGMNPLTLVLGIAFGAGFFGSQYAISGGRWIGGGDIRLGAVMGALLGWKLLLVALFVSYVSGATVGLAMIAAGRKEWGSKIPFGTFLSVGSIIALYFGVQAVRWYVGG